MPTAQAVHPFKMEPHIRVSNQLANNINVLPKIVQKLIAQNVFYKVLIV